MEQFADVVRAAASLVWAFLGVYVFVTLKSALVDALKSRNVNFKGFGIEYQMSQTIENTARGIADIQSNFASIINNSDLKNEKNFIKNGSKTNNNLSWERISVNVLKILWVDDNKDNNKLLEERFEDSGHLIEHAANTSDAISMMSVSKYDIVISDLSRCENGTENRMAGNDLIIEMKKRGFETPIFIFTSAYGVESRNLLLKSGATEVSSSAIDLFRFVNAYAQSQKS